MKFKDWIDDEKYNKYSELCTRFVNKYNSDVSEILSRVMCRLTEKNPEIFSEKEFESMFVIEIRWATLNEKKRQLKLVEISSSNTILEEYDTQMSKADEMVLKVLNSSLGELYKDRYVHSFSREKLCEKYKLTNRMLQTKLERIRKMLKGEDINIGGQEPKGIACLKNGKLVKVYCNIKAVELDGFNRSSVSKVVSGKLKTRKYTDLDWYYLSELNKIENNQ